MRFSAVGMGSRRIRCGMRWRLVRIGRGQRWAISRRCWGIRVRGLRRTASAVAHLSDEDKRPWGCAGGEVSDALCRTYFWKIVARAVILAAAGVTCCGGGGIHPTPPQLSILLLMS